MGQGMKLKTGNEPEMRMSLELGMGLRTRLVNTSLTHSLVLHCCEKDRFCLLVVS